MKYLTIFLISFLLLLQSCNAYSRADVSEHSSRDDCWVIFEGNVYDLTKYISNHDRFLNIDDWCGKDMTEDFKSKGSKGVDHIPSSYSLLDSYYIASLNDINETEINSVSREKVSNPYNMILPLLISMLAYWPVYFLIKNRKINISINKFNGFFNTILLLLLLVPALSFGIIMILRYKIPSIKEISFDFMYWHVELSLLMGFLGLNHFIQRVKMYMLQLSKKKA